MSLSASVASKLPKQIPYATPTRAGARRKDPGSKTEEQHPEIQLGVGHCQKLDGEPGSKKEPSGQDQNHLKRGLGELTQRRWRRRLTICLLADHRQVVVLEVGVLLILYCRQMPSLHRVHLLLDYLGNLLLTLCSSTPNITRHGTPSSEHGTPERTKLNGSGGYLRRPPTKQRFMSCTQNPRTSRRSRSSRPPCLPEWSVKTHQGQLSSLSQSLPRGGEQTPSEAPVSHDPPSPQAHLVHIIKLNTNMMVQDRKVKIRNLFRGMHLACGSLRMTINWAMTRLT